MLAYEMAFENRDVRGGVGSGDGQAGITDAGEVQKNGHWHVAPGIMLKCGRVRSERR